jgi:hypothetical protein
MDSLLPEQCYAPALAWTLNKLEPEAMISAREKEH